MMDVWDRFDEKPVNPLQNRSPVQPLCPLEGKEIELDFGFLFMNFIQLCDEKDFAFMLWKRDENNFLQQGLPGDQKPIDERFTICLYQKADKLKQMSDGKHYVSDDDIANTLQKAIVELRKM